MSATNRMDVAPVAHRSTDPTPRNAARQAHSGEHVFFTGYMLILIGLIFAGFAPSFYLRGVITPAAALTPLRPDIVVHGILASLFMLAFPVQAWLAARRRFKAHIRIGNWAFALGASLVPLGYVAGAGAFHAVRPVPIPPEMAAAFVAFPLFGSLFLGLALWGAWRTRFEGATHKRMMVALACQMADPAIFRLRLFELDAGGLIAVQILMLATLMPLFLWDIGKLGRIHRGTLIGSGIFVGEVILRTLVMPTDAWAAFVHALPMYGLP